MKCPDCGTFLKINAIKCSCGWEKETPKLTPRCSECLQMYDLVSYHGGYRCHKHLPQHTTNVTRIFAERERQVNKWVDKYIAKHGGTKREACLKLLEKKKINVPKNLQTPVQEPEGTMESLDEETAGLST